MFMDILTKIKEHSMGMDVHGENPKINKKDMQKFSDIQTLCACLKKKSDMYPVSLPPYYINVFQLNFRDLIYIFVAKIVLSSVRITPLVQVSE